MLAQLLLSKLLNFSKSSRIVLVLLFVCKQSFAVIPSGTSKISNVFTRENSALVVSLLKYELPQRQEPLSPMITVSSESNQQSLTQDDSGLVPSNISSKERFRRKLLTGNHSSLVPSNVPYLRRGSWPI